MCLTSNSYFIVSTCIDESTVIIVWTTNSLLKCLLLLFCRVVWSVWLRVLCFHSHWDWEGLNRRWKICRLTQMGVYRTLFTGTTHLPLQCQRKCYALHYALWYVFTWLPSRMVIDIGTHNFSRGEKSHLNDFFFDFLIVLDL